MSVRWSLCVWLCAVAVGCSGVGASNPEVSIDDSKTVKECRVHIEKALEEYWDKTNEPNADATRSKKQLDSNLPQDADFEKEIPHVDDKSCDQKDISESNPPKDTEVTATADELTETDNNEVSNDDDDNEESQGDDDDEDDEEEKEKDQPTGDSEIDQKVEDSQTQSQNTEEDSADSKLASKSDEAKPQETRRVFVVKNLNKEPIEFDDFKSDKVTKKDEADEEDDDDEDDDAEDDNATVEVDNKSVEDLKTDGELKDEGGKDKQEETKQVEEVAVPVASKVTELSGSEVSPDRTEVPAQSSQVLVKEEIPVPEIKPSVVVTPTVQPTQATTKIPDPHQKSQIETPEAVTKRETEPLTPSPAFKDDLIENIYEDDDDDDEEGLTYRSRDHVDVILGLDEVGTELEKEEDKLAQTIYKDIKKIELTHIKPMEMLYKYADSTTRALGDAEIFNKPMILFLGPWNSGKTSIINYILGIERTPAALETGTGITDTHFTVITHGPQRRVIGGTELVTDWRYAGVQRFGQGFLDHFRSIHIPHALLQKVTLVDTPGILENRKGSRERGYNLNDAFQWFIDRADAVYVVLDPNKVDIGGELSRVIDQLQGREVRFVLNKADSIRRSDLMKVVGQLFWNLSPLMSGSEAPVIYAVSLTTHPYHPSAPTRFLDDQEKNLLHDMRATLARRVENRILYARKHAVRVRNHAKMVDCYLATFYRHKSIFSNKRHVAKQIVDNPAEYSIYDGVGGTTNVSRHDLPTPAAYQDFFRAHALYDFKPLASTCSYFRGCPIDKLDEAIAKDIPELMARYKKAKMALLEADGNVVADVKP
ncbi:hypothetical protein JTE90_008265 [Oedothorax gibbosus]|uniref:G domain-containing protein n=1 Tax=Oedothorax gibbosus TaxID=931172 RepID=A0AAV6UH21_9ARAC|nr:hypothetical protein JTE90_008265 [Oedothorax gibbosus]